MTRFKAALIHLSISIIVIGLFVGVVFFIWYPKPLYSIAHVIEPLKLLVLIDVVVGPALTFIVFSKKKSLKLLRIDLSLIALLQIAALSYGIYSIYNGRSSIIVFTEGRFNYLIEKYSNADQLNSSELETGFLSKPKLSYVPKLKTADIYETYADMLPLTDFNILMPYALSVKTMKAKFKSKIDKIDLLVNLYPEDDIVFLTLDKDMSLNYIVYSKKKNQIIDELKF
jgi:hypothetical protein